MTHPIGNQLKKIAGADNQEEAKDQAPVDAHGEELKEAPANDANNCAPKANNSEEIPSKDELIAYSS